jgi:NAD(P)-dependent dehydrogenase (short-subunit alcohol dehydrogenase family)
VKLENRVAVVFGGAPGLDRASAKACAEEGASVVVADVNENGTVSWRADRVLLSDIRPQQAGTRTRDQ